MPTLRPLTHSTRRTLSIGGTTGAWMWNVGGEPELIDETIYDRIDSQREWGEVRDETTN